MELLANGNLVVLLNLLVGAVLPALVALVTARAATGWYKTVTLVALSVLTASLTELTVAVGVGSAVDLGQMGVNFVVALVTALCSHYLALKPLGVTGSAGSIQVRVPSGLGGV